MLPVVRGERETMRQILLYTLVLVAVTLLPFALGHVRRRSTSSAALALGGVFLGLALRLRREPSRRARRAPLPLLAALPRAALRRDGARRPVTPEEQRARAQERRVGLVALRARGRARARHRSCGIDLQRRHKLLMRSDDFFSVSAVVLLEFQRPGAGERSVPRYLMVRKSGVTEDRMPMVGQRRTAERTRTRRSSGTAATWWSDDDGNVKSFCIYEAPDVEMVQAHADQLGLARVNAVYEIAGDVTPDGLPARGGRRRLSARRAATRLSASGMWNTAWNATASLGRRRGGARCPPATAPSPRCRGDRVILGPAAAGVVAAAM